MILGGGVLMHSSEAQRGVCGRAVPVWVELFGVEARMAGCCVSVRF